MTPFEKRRILITCGTGGVGKTTLSAAIAVQAAISGKKTVVITIDPAKRLATSLGLSRLGDHPTDLTHQVQSALQKRGADLRCKGSLDAIVPDTRQTFETFVRELAPNPLVADRVIQNPIFQIFAKEFSGTNEYMALERLYALDQLGKYDCIILDTPPSRNTLAFLDAPQLLAQFFEERLIRWLILPANKIISSGMRKALGILEKLTGAGFMTHLFDFASALFEVRIRFAANLRIITKLLESSDVGFLMVAVPSPDSTLEANHFINNLREHRFHFDGVILNRTLNYLKVPENAPENFRLSFELLRSLQTREEKVKEQLSKNAVTIFTELPELARDIHSVEDLLHVALAFDSQLPNPPQHLELRSQE